MARINISEKLDVVVVSLKDAKILDESTIRESGLDWTFLRDGHYADAMILLAGPGYIAGGRWLTSTNGGREAMVWREDCVDCAVAVLTQDGHENKAYGITGPNLENFAEIAAMLDAAEDAVALEVHVAVAVERAVLGRDDDADGVPDVLAVEPPREQLLPMRLLRSLQMVHLATARDHWRQRRPGGEVLIELVGNARQKPGDLALQPAQAHLALVAQIGHTRVRGPAAQALAERRRIGRQRVRRAQHQAPVGQVADLHLRRREQEARPCARHGGVLLRPRSARARAR